MAARLAHYGIQPSGQIAPLESLAHLDEAGLEMARLLRDLLAHKRARTPEAKVWKAFDGAVYDLLQEQGFTALNRLCALRMAEERKLIVQCVGKGQQSEGFELFEYHTGKSDESCSVEVRYQQFLYAFFDELALDLGALFARHSPQGLLFPSPQALAALLAEINHPDLAPLWAEDETIGWIYQYWNSQEERRAMRDASAAPRNSRELAVRNQFFTPRYVVEFLTDNTLGRIWYEMMQGRTVLKEQCRYLVRRPNEIFLAPGESATETPVADNLSQEELLRQPVHIPHRPLKDPREIRLLDPACGSMHFGLYAFDLFEAIYAEAWDLAERSKAEGGANTPEFSSFGRLVASFPSKAAFLREVPRLIIEHNIHGIDIDPRAAQVAGLSLWLRAQRTWHSQNVPAAERPPIRRSNIVCAEPMPGEKELLREFVEQTFPLEERPIFQRLLEAVFEKMQLAGEAGSLLKIEEEIQTAIAEARTRWKAGPRLTQGLLFGGADSTTAQEELDLSRVTDELFWERVEDRIYAALGEYAAQAESTGYSRRLFAEDAAKGFAFIEVCRKRYDAVVMNPPFGDPSESLVEHCSKYFPSWNQNLLCAFIERGAELRSSVGSVGTIYDRTAVVKSTYEDFRSNVILGQQLRTLLDLGWEVLDANVEVVCMVLDRLNPHHPKSVCFDVRTTPPDLKGNYALDKVTSMRGVVCSQELFKTLPNCVIGYDFPPVLLRVFSRYSALKNSGAKAHPGLQIKMDQFVRLRLEIDAGKLANRSYVNLYNGSPFCRFYAPVTDCVLWNGDGSVLRAHESTRWNNPHRYFSSGVGYGKRGETLDAHPLPRDVLFTIEGLAVFPNEANHFYYYLGILNSPLCTWMINFFCGQHKHAGYVDLLPVPSRLNENDWVSQFESAVESAVRAKQRFDSHHELSPYFLLPFNALRRASIQEKSSELNALALEATQFTKPLEKFAEHLFDFSDEEIELLQPFISPYSNDCASPHENDLVNRETALPVAASAISYALGAAFGRWDIRFATGERQPPELPDPFAPLPVCPPGMLQNAAGLPAGPEDVSADYLVKNIPWHGILVDDPEHPMDIERRIRGVIEIIWTGQNGAPNAAAIEAEACELLEVRSLREYFRKPAGFFADHLKRYSKSRRKAPIYWPLSTPSGGYTIWLYYHRLNDGTLYKVVEQFVEPKQAEVQATFQTLAAKESRSRAEDRELENAQTLLGELAAFRDDLLRLAKIWKPNLNDGVVITAAPLWRHFRLPAWQKELRTTWESLERGEYDWAHLAYSLWPERVTEKCKTDRSLAIAHGLEYLCTIEPPKPKKKRAKAKAEEENPLI
jgi:hypothetical protein